MFDGLMKYFNKQPRLGTLSTSDKNGKVNSAYFGSPRMIDDLTIEMGIGKNRTLANLQENPQAVFLIMEPGEALPQWKGVRIYARMTECATSGEKLDGIRKVLTEKAGEKAAQAVQAAVTFQVYEVRPLADFGQGWQRSI
jgi:hypothetical protein